MGAISNKDLERSNFDRELPDRKKQIPDYSEDYKKFRRKYKTSPKPIEPKGWDEEPIDETELISETEPQI